MNAIGVQRQVDQHLSSQAEIERRLADILAQLAAQPAMLSVSDDNPREVISKDFPYHGATRVLLARTPQAPAPVNGLAQGLAFPSNANRVGGIVVNQQTEGLTLVLSDQPRSASGTIWLPPNGGQWNFKLGDVVWCGNVYAIADTTTVKIAGAEV